MEFNIQDISNIFKNINHKPCNSPGYDYAFDILDKEKFIGELFFCKEDKELVFIKDNYPMPRKAFRTTFPVKTIESFVELFKTVKIELIKTN